MDLSGLSTYGLNGHRKVDEHPADASCGVYGTLYLSLYLWAGNLIPPLHDQAGSTSWLYVSWTSQLDVCLIV